MIITNELDGHRLDFAVSRELGVSRAYAQKLVRDGRVELSDGRRLKPSMKTAKNERYEINVPPAERLELEPEDVPFGVVHADEDIIVVDKPAGVVVHPAPGHFHGTLVHGLLFRFPEFGNLNGVSRPGIVHRLDATTSGLMVVARSGLAMERLHADFKSRRVEKTYLFLCAGKPKEPAARIDIPIGRGSDGKKMAAREDGRDAVTVYETLWSTGDYSFAKCSIHTGRTHQIRVHMASIGNPLIGDEAYGHPGENPFTEPRVFLHAWRLSFAHPRSGEKLAFRSFIPEELKNFLLRIRGRASSTAPPK
jgi:23S rRNA pseudouridine1911/1915/1917 synthase